MSSDLTVASGPIPSRSEVVETPCKASWIECQCDAQAVFFLISLLYAGQP